MQMTIKRDAIAVEVNINTEKDEYQLVAVRPKIIITDEDRVNDIFILTKTEWMEGGDGENGPKMYSSRVITDFEIDGGDETSRLIDKMFAGDATHDDVLRLIKGGTDYAAFVKQMCMDHDKEQNAQNL